jgi:glycosyltransferase involved in cell wall biosynthesis
VKVLYINLVPITVGGGLQNAINFLKNIESKELKNSEIIIILKNNSDLIKICKDRNFKFVVIQNSFSSRLYFETFFFYNKKNSIIFTLFGTKPILSWNNTTITGCAYSNLFYKNIDFWGYLSPLKKLIKQIKDKYRFLNVKSSDVVIFETELLMKKAISDFKFDQNNTYTVKMAVSSDVNHKTSHELNIDINSKNYNILYLGSSHPNKRQHLLPKIILELKKRNTHDFKFIITMNKNDSYTKKLFEEIDKYNLNDYIQNLEYIENKYVANLIGKCDAMINIAALESFSNNFVEAWQMKKPLLVTNDDWAKGSCANAAYYLDTEDISKVASQIENLIKNPAIGQNIIEQGIKQLKTYPTPKEKISEFVNIINKYTKD